MCMNVRQKQTIVIRTLTALILKDHLSVRAKMDLMEMVLIVKVCVDYRCPCFKYIANFELKRKILLTQI